MIFPYGMYDTEPGHIIWHGIKEVFSVITWFQQTEQTAKHKFKNFLRTFRGDILDFQGKNNCQIEDKKMFLMISIKVI